MKDDLVYIEHILQALQRISNYTNDMEQADFLIDNRTQDACIRQFEIVGEATNGYHNPSEIDLLRFHGGV